MRLAISMRPRGARTTSVSTSASTIVRPHVDAAAPTHTTGSASRPSPDATSEPAAEQRQRDPERPLRGQVVPQHHRQKVEARRRSPRTAARRARPDARRAPAPTASGRPPARSRAAATAAAVAASQPASATTKYAARRRARDGAADRPPLRERQPAQRAHVRSLGGAHHREVYPNDENDPPRRQRDSGWPAAGTLRAIATEKGDAWSLQPAAGVRS